MDGPETFLKKQYNILLNQSKQLGFTISELKTDFTISDVSETTILELKILPPSDAYSSYILINKIYVSTNKGVNYTSLDSLIPYAREALITTTASSQKKNNALQPFKTLFGTNKLSINEVADTLISLADIVPSNHKNFSNSGNQKKYSLSFKSQSNKIQIKKITADCWASWNGEGC